jgi:hypothetical protein
MGMENRSGYARQLDKINHRESQFSRIKKWLKAKLGLRSKREQEEERTL